MTNPIQTEIDTAVAEIVAKIKGQDVYFAEASMNYLLRQLSWALIEDAEIDKHAVSEQLQGMSEVVMGMRTGDGDPA